MKSKLYLASMLAGLLAVVGCVSIAFWKPKQTFNTVSVTSSPEITTPDLQNDVELQRTCAEMFREMCTFVYGCNKIWHMTSALSCC